MCLVYNRNPGGSQASVGPGTTQLRMLWALEQRSKQASKRRQPHQEWPRALLHKSTGGALPGRRTTTWQASGPCVQCLRRCAKLGRAARAWPRPETLSHTTASNPAHHHKQHSRPGPPYPYSARARHHHVHGCVHTPAAPSHACKRRPVHAPASRRRPRHQLCSTHAHTDPATSLTAAVTTSCYHVNKACEALHKKLAT